LEGYTMHRLDLVLLVGIVIMSAGRLPAQDPGAGYFSNNAAVESAPEPKPESWWQRFKRDYHRNHCWPEPFIADDRVAVIQPFQIMADNAWQRQNLLCDYHFVEGKAELNSAGLYQLRWIVTKAPNQRKAVFVERTASNAATVGRIAAVQNAMMRMNPNAPPLPVYESNLGGGYWQGEDADAVLRDSAKTRPEPRLPHATPAAISN
jgi:hypothetical protein